MDDLTLIKTFRAERDSEPPAAREAVWRALEARSEGATEEGPGQFIYSKVNRLEVKGWVSPVPHPRDDVPTATGGGTMNGPHAYNAVVATQDEQWLGIEGEGRHREELGAIDFWSAAEEDRWK